MATAPQVNDRHYAVVVGIDWYPAFPPKLTSARRDAERFKQWLVTGGGLSPDNVIEVVAKPLDEEARQSADGRPTSLQVEYAFLDVRRRINKRRSGFLPDTGAFRLYVYAAGHGIAPPNGNAALVMADAESGLLDYIELSLYQTWFVECGDIDELVIFADCCREALPDISRPEMRLKRCRTSSSRRTFALVGYATRYRERAFAPVGTHDLDRGFFTEALLDGLGGQARDADGSITAASLASYVAPAVEARSNGKQIVEMPVDPAHPIIFAAGGANGSQGAVRRTITIYAPISYNGPLVLRDGQLQTVAQWNTTESPKRLPLQEGLYEVVVLDAAGQVSRSLKVFRVIGRDDDIRL